MKFNIWSVIFIGLGIICIFIGITSLGTQKYANRIGARIFILGIILIVISLIGWCQTENQIMKKKRKSLILEKLKTIVANVAALLRNNLMGSKLTVNFFI
jgi:uncharacterized membrane protein